jgi:hypothetical protein
MSFGDLKVQDLIYEDSSNNEITVVIADLATKANPTFTGIVTVPTAPASDVSTKAASTAFVDSYYATKASPTFTGTPTVPGYASLAGAAFTGAVTGTNLTLSGNLVVNGTTTTINTQTLDVEDKNITMGNVSSPSNTTAEAGGLTLKGGSDGDKTLNWLAAPGFGVTEGWTSSENICVASSKIFYSASTTSNKYLRVYAGGTTGLWDIYGNGANLEFMDHANSGSVIFNRDARLIDAKHIKFGAGDDMRLYSDGTNGYVQGDELRIGTASNTTNAVFTNTKFDFRRDVDITNSAKLGIGGAYGSSGQVLTSGGSGAAPSWAAVPAGGNTFTAVANGSIANNKAVKIDTDGKVSEIKISETAYSNPQSGGSADVVTDEIQDPVCCKLAENKTVTVYSLDASNTRQGWAFISTVTASGTGFSNVTRGTHVRFTGTGQEQVRNPSVTRHSDTKFVITWVQNASTVKVWAVVATVSGTTITFGTPTAVHTGSSAWNITRSSCCVYDSNAGRVLVFYSTGTSNSNHFKYRYFSVHIGTTVTSISGEFQIGYNEAPYRIDAVFDSDNNRVIAAWTVASGGGYKIYSASINSSATNPTNGTIVFQYATSSSDAKHVQISEDSTNERFMLTWSQNNKVYANYITANGATLTINGGETGGAIEIYSAGNNETYPNVEYDSSTNLYLVTWLDCSDDCRSHGRFVSISGSTIATSGNATRFTTTSGSYMSLCQFRGGLYWMPTRQAGDDLHPFVIRTVQMVSNITVASHYVGFADQAYTNGQTATIKTYGNNVDTLSGLTAGTEYYLQQDGTVGTSTGFPAFAAYTPLAGTALSATKLLIRDPYARA